jgi:P27 family predicted phage terminase small subunit
MKKKPLQQHINEGTLRPCVHNTNEPKFETSEDLREPPSYMDDAGAAVYRADVGPLIESRVLTVADVGIFADLCTMTAAYRQVMAEIGTDYVVTGLHDVQVKSPAWQIAREMLTLINSMRLQMGLSPVSRSKVTALPEPKAESPWARFETPMRTGPKESEWNEFLPTAPIRRYEAK